MLSRLKKILIGVFSASQLLVFAFPASTNYSLRSFEFGSGGGYDMNSTNYSLEGLSGESVTERQSSSNYAANSGLEFVQMSHTPVAPALTNDDDWYDKLKIIINVSDNPSDTGFAVAISDDDFVTTEYVKSDGTVGATLVLSDFRTYAGWGGASGSMIIGLDPNKTYKVKSKARQGTYTEGPWGTIASASTGSPSISLDIDIYATDSETAPPYSMSVGDLYANTVTTSSDKIWIDFETNAYAGGEVFVKDQYSGLRSSQTSYTISSATADLAVVASGYGLRIDSATQSSGGPFTAVSPYNGVGDNVGILDTTFRTIFSSAGPVSGGRGSILAKAKITDIVPAADNYNDTLTIVVSAVF